MATSGDLEIFSQTGWLSRQTASFRKVWLEQGRIITVRRGEAIYREGDEGRNMYGLIAGGVAVIIGPPRLAPRLATIMGAGTWFGAGPVLTGELRSIEFRAAEDSSFLMVQGPAVEQLARAQPENARAIGALAMIGHDLAVRVAAELLIPSSARRVAAVILRTAAPDSHEGRVGSEDVCVSQTQLAEMANVSRNVANAALRHLRDAGWIDTRYSRIRVLNVVALATFAYDDV
jgi:CRP-like cAMP-binding protein